MRESAEGEAGLGARVEGGEGLGVEVVGVSEKAVCNSGMLSRESKNKKKFTNKLVGIRLHLFMWFTWIHVPRKSYCEKFVNITQK